jgi:GMP synthase (glutamine-hydrolysing)
MKVLLIQARDPEDPMKSHEVGCFLSQSGLSPGQLTVANAVASDSFPIDEADAVFIGGSGKYSATSDFPWMPPVIDAIREIEKKQKPLFGSCWGFHMIGRAFGAPVVTQEATKEIGTYAVTLTENGRSDELFSYLPFRFMAQLGHKDHVARLPESAVHLASSETHHNQAFRIKNLPIYATQFHPELTAEDMRIRIRHYLDLGYVDDEEKKYLSDVMDRFSETPEVSLLLRNFIQHFCV